MHLCNFSVNRKLFQNTKVTREKGIHADGALDFPWISCMPEETRPLLQGLGASEIPFDCRHLAGPAAQGASARHPHSRTLVAVPAASRPLIPAPGHGRHSRPRPRELLSGPRPWRQAPRRCPTAKGSAATSRRPPAPPTPSPGIQESPVAPGPPSSSRAPEALPPRPRDVRKRALDPDSAAALGPRRPSGPLGRDSRCPGRGTLLTRGRSHAAAAGKEQQRPQPAEPRRPLHAAPRSEPGRAAAAAVSASFAPCTTSWLCLPGGGGPGHTGRATRPTGRR